MIPVGNSCVLGVGLMIAVFLQVTMVIALNKIKQAIV